MLLAVRARGGSGGSTEHVAHGLARDAAREQLRPLLDAACARLASVLHRAFDIAVEAQQLSKGTPAHAPLPDTQPSLDVAARTLPLRRSWWLLTYTCCSQQFSGELH